MFDRVTIIPRSANMDVPPPETRIIEQRAPTDDSVRILNEMQQKALNNMLASVQVTSNILKLKIFGFNDRQIGCYKIQYIIDLNGERIVETRDVSMFDIKMSKDPVQYIVDEVYKHISEIIIAHLYRNGTFEHEVMEFCKSMRIERR
jgi:hypothetical protein